MRVRRSRRFSLEGLPARRVWCVWNAALERAAAENEVSKWPREARDPAALLCFLLVWMRGEGNNQ